MILAATLQGSCQILEDDDYVSEITWGVNKNTNSALIGGIVFKLARQKSGNVFTSYGLEFQNVRHPSELKRGPTQAGTSYIFGKQNWLYSIRFNYGRERLLFKKAPQQGVQIGLIAAAGPTLGIVAPYYILNNNGNYEQYDPNKHSNIQSINGSGKLFQGLGESELAIGANAKAGVNFEFGAFKNNVAGVEIGGALEAFTKEIILIPTKDNRAIFPSFYFTLYWGTRK